MSGTFFMFKCYSIPNRSNLCLNQTLRQGLQFVQNGTKFDLIQTLGLFNLLLLNDFKKSSSILIENSDSNKIFELNKTKNNTA